MIASNGLRLARLFFFASGVSTTASISSQKFSHRTNAAMASSGSPFADSAANRRSVSKIPDVPSPASLNHLVTPEIRMTSQNRKLFEAPNK
jgi:hypothetical protein